MTYLHVLSFFIGNHDLHHKMVDMGRNGFLADSLHELAELHRQALLALQIHQLIFFQLGPISRYLLLANERAPEHANALADHRDLKLVLLLEPVNDLRERRVVLELEAVPERPLGRAVLLLGREDRLGKAEERQSQVDEAILVLLNVLLAVDDLGQR